MDMKLFKVNVRSEATLVFSLFIGLTIIRFVATTIEPIWFPLLFAYAFLPLILVKRNMWKEMGLRKPEKPSGIVWGSVLACLIKLVTIVSLYELFGTTTLNWIHSISEHYHSMPNLPVGIIIVILIFTIGTPLAEEVFFRMSQSILNRKYTGVGSLFISAFMFGFCHIDEFVFPFSISGILLRLIPIFIYGLVHAWVYYKTRSTFASMISHVIGNIAEAVILMSFF